MEGGEVDQQLGGGGALGALAQGDVGADVLAVDLVVDPDGAGKGDGGVLVEGALDLVGADVGPSWTITCFLRPRNQRQRVWVTPFAGPVLPEVK